MQRQRRTGTHPELVIRRLVSAAGLRYKVDAVLPVLGLRRRADMLFRRSKVAVFVDGCYWHACPEHGTMPKANAMWWAEKLAANVSRDRRTPISACRKSAGRFSVYGSTKTQRVRRRGSPP